MQQKLKYDDESSYPGLVKLYWFSLMQMPPKSDFPGTGPNSNGIGPNIKSQGRRVGSPHSSRPGRLPMSARFNLVGCQRALKMYADWSDRIAHGELPVDTPS